MPALNFEMAVQTGKLSVDWAAGRVAAEYQMPFMHLKLAAELHDIVDNRFINFICVGVALCRRRSFWRADGFANCIGHALPRVCLKIGRASCREGAAVREVRVKCTNYC